MKEKTQKVCNAGAEALRIMIEIELKPIEFELESVSA
jgi:hypothetical protein